MLDQVLAWIGANIELTGVLLAIAGMVGGGIAWTVNLFRRKSDAPNATPSVTVQQHPTAINIDTDTIPEGASGKISLTLEAYETRIQLARDEVQAQIRDASGEQLQLLTRKREEYETRLADIEPAFEQATARIAELEAIIEREGNLLGAEDLAEAEAALANGDFDAAEQLLIRIEDQGDLEVKRTARAAYGRGQIAEEQVRWLDAAEHYAKAARLDPTHENLREAGDLLWQAGRYEEALRIGEERLKLSKQQFGEQAEETSNALDRLATFHQSLGQYEASEPLYRQAIEIGKATIGETHPDYATRLNNLATLLRNMGRHDDAEPLFRQSIEIDKATIGETHPAYAIRLNNLATLLRATGRYDEAEPLYRQATEITKTALGETHPAYAIRLNNLANLLQHMGRYDEARPMHAQKHEIEVKALGLDHPQTKRGAANYARLLRAHFPDDPALAELESTFGPDIGR